MACYCFSEVAGSQEGGKASNQSFVKGPCNFRNGPTHGLCLQDSQLFSSLGGACPELGAERELSSGQAVNHLLCAKHRGEYAERQGRVFSCKGLTVGREENSHSPVQVRQVSMWL